MVSADIIVSDILTRYESPRRIGGGGQKVVYVVQDRHKGAIVIKIGGYRSSQALERARREFSTLSIIDSKYFPRQFGFEVLDQQRYLIVEEFLDGSPLHDCFSGFCNEQLVLGLAIELVKGLSELWNRRIVHRDIKPANIMITTSGPKIIDLGIARLLDATSLTYSMAPIGPCTPNYASPEQLRNSKRDIDHRSDQFSLGILLAQLLLSGNHPFDPQIVGGESIPNNILCGLWSATDLDSRVGDSFRILIHKLLAIQPYMRYRLSSDLESALIKINEECIQ
jgi:serine/threonine-protein kinase